MRLARPPSSRSLSDTSTFALNVSSSWSATSRKLSITTAASRKLPNTAAAASRKLSSATFKCDVASTGPFDAAEQRFSGGSWSDDATSSASTTATAADGKRHCSGADANTDSDASATSAASERRTSGAAAASSANTHTDRYNPADGTSAQHCWRANCDSDQHSGTATSGFQRLLVANERRRCNRDHSRVCHSRWLDGFIQSAYRFCLATGRSHVDKLLRDELCGLDSSQ